MKSTFLLVLKSVLFVSLFATALNLQAQGTAFTYQGLLDVSNSPATGSYDLTFALFNNSNGVSGQIGITQTNLGVDVSNGLFSVTLNFGAVFNGSNYWVEVAARTNNGAAFTNLSPLLSINPAPYAIYAGTATALSGTVANGNISGTYTNLVTFSNASNVFVGNGAGLTNLANVWNLTGNAGTTPGTQFLGTTDSNALELHVNGTRAFRLEPNAGGPNVIGGSSGNSVAAGTYAATIAGGAGNSILGYATGSAIVGGQTNNIGSYASGSSIGGGQGNIVQGDADYSSIAGGQSNTVQSEADYSSIAGGRGNIIQGYATGSAIVGGQTNSIGSDASGSSIGGGQGNTVQGDADYSSIAGGQSNTIQSEVNYSSIGGGQGNTIQEASYASIGGGQSNTLQQGAHYSSVVGGVNNNIGEYADHSFIGGGNSNTIQYNAFYGSIAGGVNNTIQSNADRSTIGGGLNNTVSALYAVIPGGANNLAAGNYSFAAGNQAQAANQGAFVWADSQDATFASTNNDSFNIRAEGGVIIYDNAGATAGVFLGSNSPAWATISDRNAKKNFKPVDTVGILNRLAAIPIQQWNYKWDKDSDVPNIGPMAQDFKGAFYPGRDDKSITTLEFDGVELAAIQGLNQKLEAESKAKDAKIASLEKKVADMEARFQKLEKAVASMTGGNTPTLAASSAVRTSE